MDGVRNGAASTGPVSVASRPPTVGRPADECPQTLARSSRRRHATPTDVAGGAAVDWSGHFDLDRCRGPSASEHLGVYVLQAVADGLAVKATQNARPATLAERSARRAHGDDPTDGAGESGCLDG